MFSVVSGEIRNDESCLRRLQWVSALFQGKSLRKQHWFRADFPCSEFLVFQRCVRENQRCSALIQRWFFCSENLVFQRCFRENQLCFRENQRWNSSDSALIFLLWKFPFSALFRAESALFRDFQVMNGAETDLKVFWIRADQRWMSLRRQPG